MSKRKNTNLTTKTINKITELVTAYNQDPDITEAQLREFSRNSLNAAIDVLGHIRNVSALKAKGKHAFLNILLPRTAKSSQNDISFLLAQNNLPFNLKVNYIKKNEFTVSNAIVFYTLCFNDEGMLNTISNGSTAPFPAHNIIQIFSDIIKHAKKAEEAKAEEAQAEEANAEAEAENEAKTKKHKTNKKDFKTKLKGSLLNNEVWSNDQNN